MIIFAMEDFFCGQKIRHRDHYPAGGDKTFQQVVETFQQGSIKRFKFLQNSDNKQKASPLTQNQSTWTTTRLGVYNRPPTYPNKKISYKQRSR